MGRVHSIAMSALLQGNGSPIPITDGVIAPDHIDNGIPYTAAGAVAVENIGTIDHYHQGLPFTVAGRLSTAINGALVRIGNGAAPFNAANFLTLSTSAVDHFNSGVPYDANGRVVVVSV